LVALVIGQRHVIDLAHSALLLHRHLLEESIPHHYGGGLLVVGHNIVDE
jgi:hypothetical protein